jgi:hypothetical protein
MRNKLTLANSFFVLFLFGKVAGIGTLATCPWWRIIAFLILDWVLDFAFWAVDYYGIRGRLIAAINRVRARAIIKRTYNQLKNQK